MVGLFVEIIFLIKFLTTFPLKKWCCSTKEEDSNRNDMTADLIFGALLVGVLITVHILVTGTNCNRSDIWTNTFLNGMFQELFMTPVGGILAQSLMVRALKTNYMKSRPKLQEVLSLLVNTEVSLLMVSFIKFEDN